MRALQFFRSYLAGLEVDEMLARRELIASAIRQADYDGDPLGDNPHRRELLALIDARVSA